MGTLGEVRRGVLGDLVQVDRARVVRRRLAAHLLGSDLVEVVARPLEEVERLAGIALGELRELLEVQSLRLAQLLQVDLEPLLAWRNRKAGSLWKLHVVDEVRENELGLSAAEGAAAEVAHLEREVALAVRELAFAGHRAARRAREVRREGHARAPRIRRLLACV
jgi:hypothetical protein